MFVTLKSEAVNVLLADATSRDLELPELLIVEVEIFCLLGGEIKPACSKLNNI